MSSRLTTKVMVSVVSSSAQVFGSAPFSGLTLRDSGDAYELFRNVSGSCRRGWTP